jgi:hypothetical protein
LLYAACLAFLAWQHLDLLLPSDTEDAPWLMLAAFLLALLTLLYAALVAARLCFLHRRRVVGPWTRCVRQRLGDDPLDDAERECEVKDEQTAFRVQLASDQVAVRRFCAGLLNDSGPAAAAAAGGESSSTKVPSSASSSSASTPAASAPSTYSAPFFSPSKAGADNDDSPSEVAQLSQSSPLWLLLSPLLPLRVRMLLAALGTLPARLFALLCPQLSVAHSLLVEGYLCIEQLVFQHQTHFTVLLQHFYHRVFHQCN